MYPEDITPEDITPEEIERMLAALGFEAVDNPLTEELTSDIIRLLAEEETQWRNNKSQSPRFGAS